MFLSVVIVYRDKPVSFLHEEIRSSTNQLLSRSDCTGLLVSESSDDFHEIIVSVGGQGVPSGIQTKRGSSWYGKIKCDIGRILVEKLDVQVSEWRDGDCNLLSQGHLLEGCAIGGEVSCGGLLSWTTLTGIWNRAGKAVFVSPSILDRHHVSSTGSIYHSTSLGYLSLTGAHQGGGYNKSEGGSHCYSKDNKENGDSSPCGATGEIFGK